MRLIHAASMKLVEVLEKDKPKYAILSHTWNDDEVTFQDMVKGTAQGKKGYTKIEYCCKQALVDALEYTWVDTCCIDKRSSAELSEAINSMFQWYADAVVCYVYLCDLPGNKLGKMVHEKFSPEFSESFRNCRWWTRGWTLQELLAPRTVVFYTADWRNVGVRDDLTKSISDITLIPIQALRSRLNVVKSYSVAQKFSWAAQRITTREEDAAYCLLGLFDVNMPLLYGEGKKAFIRLQEEIMKNSDDQSIFTWEYGFPSIAFKLTGLLAESPKLFVNCSNIVPFQDWKVSQPYSMTNSGLRINGLLLDLQQMHVPETDDFGTYPEDYSRYRLCLQCYNTAVPHGLISIPLVRLSGTGDQFARLNSSWYPIHTRAIMNFYNFQPEIAKMQPQTIYIRKDITRLDVHGPRTDGKKVAFHVVIRSPVGAPFTVQNAWPLKQWDNRSALISAPDKESFSLTLSNWSWHVVLVIACSTERQAERSCLVLAIGFNGRTGKCWFNFITVAALEFQVFDQLCYNTWHDINATDTTAGAEKFELKGHQYIAFGELKEFPNARNMGHDGQLEVVEMVVGIQRVYGD